MWIFYVSALLPICAGAFFFFKDKRVHWAEWIIGSVAALLLALLFQFLAFRGQTSDIETWSGKIIKAVHYPQWLEYYEEAIYKTRTYTTGSGKNKVTHTETVFSHYSPRMRNHPEYWVAYSDIDTKYNITKNKFDYLVNKFGNISPQRGDRSTFEHASRMISGDPNDYVASFVNGGWIEPITKIVSFQNRIKAAPTVFSFNKVPTNIFVFSYPENKNPFSSDRLMGDSERRIGKLNFDQLNSRVGKRKKVNLIILGFTNQPSSSAEYQRAAYIGGKKNDIVMCYSWNSGNKKVDWAKVFGWSESDICKKNIESLFLERPINNSLLPLIEEEIVKNYTIKDWSEFDYIAIEPPLWSIITFFCFLAVTQTGLWIFFHRNDLDKDW